MEEILSTDLYWGHERPAKKGKVLIYVLTILEETLSERREETSTIQGLTIRGRL